MVDCSDVNCTDHENDVAGRVFPFEIGKSPGNEVGLNLQVMGLAPPPKKENSKINLTVKQ